MADELDIKKHMRLAFPTPVVIYRWPDSDEFNAGPRKTILTAEAAEPGIARSNVGGWHSDNDFLQRDDAPIKAFGQRLQEMTMALTKATGPKKSGRYRVNFRFRGWANVARRGDYHQPHNHPTSIWSGVYYVSIGQRDAEPGLNGLLELLDPRVGANMMPMPGGLFETRNRIDPEPGLMVMFPSWINHLVHPYHGEDARITIAFNVLATNFEELAEEG
jgi:uncharacterized protein (TIGR02466 family)